MNYSQRLEEVQSEWKVTVLDTVRDLATAHAGERFYAGSFWLCYVDYTMFGVPCFAMNTEAHAAAHGGNTSEGIRWSPPNWEFDVIDRAVERMQPHYQKLSHDLADRENVVWDAAIDEHFRVLARVCREATEAVHQWRASGVIENITEDFVIGIFEEREDDPLFSRLVRDSIAPDRLSRLPCPLWY
jgi:hypothetical protein